MFQNHIDTCTTNVTTVSIKGLPQWNFCISCRVAKRERKLYSKRQDKTRRDRTKKTTQEDELDLYLYLTYRNNSCVVGKIRLLAFDYHRYCKISRKIKQIRMQ